MQRIYGALRTGQPRLTIRPGAALRDTLAAGYGFSQFRQDATAGIIVGIVALPLSMALAIATGVPPQHGLYTAIVGGGLAALLGGSRTQVTGPTAAFVAVLAPISATYGLRGLLLATMMAGVMLVAMGLARMGRLIQYIPFPVSSGFTAGIAVVIAVGQLPDLLGLSLAGAAAHLPERALIIARALPTVHAADLAIGAFTLGMLVGWPAVTRKVPAPLVAMTVSAVVAALLTRWVPGFDVQTIASRFSYESGGLSHAGIPALPPLAALPWNTTGAGDTPIGLSLTTLRQLLPAAAAIAMLGGIESLLSAVVADGMTRDKHDPNVELVAQGIGNIVAPFFGGFASTGAIARTATNIRAGGRTPVAAAIHALFVLVAVLTLAPLLGYLPMASLAALLLLVAWNMAELKHVRRTLKVAPRSDSLVLVTCLVMTVMLDMVIAVATGIVLAALLFMRRMADLTGATRLEGHHPELREPLPDGVVLYQIAGPLFFGAAEKAMSSLHVMHADTRVVILDLSAVPVMDATGLVNLDSTLDRLRGDRRFVILSNLQQQPRDLLQRAGFTPVAGELAFSADLHEAADVARAALGSSRGGG